MAWAWKDSGDKTRESNFNVIPLLDLGPVMQQFLFCVGKAKKASVTNGMEPTQGRGYLKRPVIP